VDSATGTRQDRSQYRCAVPNVDGKPPSDPIRPGTIQKRTFGLYDSLHNTYRARKLTYDFKAAAPSVHLLGNSRHHDIVLDRPSQRLEWWADGRIACRISDTEIPSDLLICLGLATLSAIETSPAENYSAAGGRSVSFGPVSVGTTSPQGLAEVDF
jgi:hypothetical protein